MIIALVLVAIVALLWMRGQRAVRRGYKPRGPSLYASSLACRGCSRWGLLRIDLGKYGTYWEAFVPTPTHWQLSIVWRPMRDAAAQ